MKRLMVLTAILTVVLAATHSALAQESIVATGVLEKPENTTYMYGTHAITDEVSDAAYVLGSEDTELLDSYVGQRVSIYGELVPGYENGQVEGGPPLLNVSRVESAS
jgi:hypothetical protein